MWRQTPIYDLHCSFVIPYKSTATAKLLNTLAFNQSAISYEFTRNLSQYFAKHQTLLFEAKHRNFCHFILMPYRAPLLASYEVKYE